MILGCGTFGGIGGARHLVGKGLDESASADAMDEAARLGIHFWDTASRYADGASETMIGEWLRSRPKELTTSIRIATKVAPASLSGETSTPFDRHHVADHLNASLARLGRPRVELFLAHAPCAITPVDVVVEAFAAVAEDGRAERIGCCNIDAPWLRAALDAADRLGVQPFEWVQNGYSLLNPDAENEVRAICRERGIAFSPYSPLAGGILAGRYRRGQPPPPDSRLALRPDGQALSPAIHDALDRLRQIADGVGVDCASLALAWLFRHPDCLAPVVGPARRGPHLNHVARARALQLDDDTWLHLQRVFASASSRPENAA
ncbi:MAG TPA: aldo/keto reductase [Burkholderiaceae bacterium]|nr:aldo/keto reductase [Burkholderiaceae bacterium]